MLFVDVLPTRQDKYRNVVTPRKIHILRNGTLCVLLLLLCIYFCLFFCVIVTFTIYIYFGKVYAPGACLLPPTRYMYVRPAVC